MENIMNQDPKHEDRARYEALLLQSKKMKRKLLFVLGGVLAGILLLVGVMALVNHLATPSAPTPPELNITFYDPYPGDIMQNKDYLELDRRVEYCDNPSGYGQKVSVTEENREEFDANVLFLCDYVQTIIDGDCNAYNAMFNDAYFKKNDPQEAFTPQMVYDIKLRYYTQESRDLITYRLDYKIYRNDGNFRRDIGSDASRPQYVTLRISEDGVIAIERLITEYNVLQ